MSVGHHIGRDEFVGMRNSFEYIQYGTPGKLLWSRVWAHVANNARRTGIPQLASVDQR